MPTRSQAPVASAGLHRRRPLPQSSALRRKSAASRHEDVDTRATIDPDAGTGTRHHGEKARSLQLHPTPVSNMAIVLVLLIIMTPVRFPLAMDTEKTFFSSLDSTIQGPQDTNPSKREVIVERYLRLLARLDIFGMYCDHRNRVGYSTRVAVLQRGSVRLERWSKEIFGRVGAYNRFEKYRTQESLRYVKTERARTCKLNEEQFLFFTSMAPKDFRVYLSDPPFGSL